MQIMDKGLLLNPEFMLGFLGDRETFFNEQYDIVLVEFPKPRGQPMYWQLVDTIYWIGRMDQACSMAMQRVDRKDVKMTLCGTAKAKDSNVSAAIKAIFEEVYENRLIHHPGRRSPVIGSAQAPGPLYGVVKDIWAALAVCMTYADGLGKNSKVAYTGHKTDEIKARRTPRAYSKPQK
jgi:hypothetical protein